MSTSTTATNTDSEAVRWDVVLAAQQDRQRIVRTAVASARRRGATVTQSIAEDLFDEKVIYAAARPAGERGAYPHETIRPATLGAWLIEALVTAIRNHDRARVRAHVSLDGVSDGASLADTLTANRGREDPVAIAAGRDTLEQLVDAMPERARRYFLAAYVRDLARKQIKELYGWSDDQIKDMRELVHAVLLKARDNALALTPGPLLLRLRARLLGLERGASGSGASGLREQLAAAGAASGATAKVVAVGLLAAGAVATAGVGLEHTLTHPSEHHAARTHHSHHVASPGTRAAGASSEPGGASSRAAAVAQAVTNVRSSATAITHASRAAVAAAHREAARARARARQRELLHSSMGALAVGGPPPPPPVSTTAAAASAPPGAAPASSAAPVPVQHGGGTSLNYLGGG